MNIELNHTEHGELDSVSAVTTSNLQTIQAGLYTTKQEKQTNKNSTDFFSSSFSCHFSV